MAPRGAYDPASSDTDGAAAVRVSTHRVRRASPIHTVRSSSDSRLAEHGIAADDDDDVVVSSASSADGDSRGRRPTRLHVAPPGTMNDMQLHPHLRRTPATASSGSYSAIDWANDFMISFRSKVFHQRRRALRRRIVDRSSTVTQPQILHQSHRNSSQSPSPSPQQQQQQPSQPDVTLESVSRWRRVSVILYDAVDAGQTWIVVVSIAFFLGLLSGYIDIVAAWLFSFKTGHCVNHWYLSRDICCRASINEKTCPEFRYWGSGLLILSPFVNWFVYTVASTLLAFVCALLVVKYAPLAAGSGNAEIKTILGGFRVVNFLSPSTMIIKTFAIPLMVATGLAVGKEGPMIHIASCVAVHMAKLSNRISLVESRRREMIAAACAAGIGVAFAAPIGGVLFTMEELSSYFPNKTMLYCFFCALFATVTMALVDPYRGKHVLYNVPNYRRWNFFEIFFFIIIGVANGVVGALVIKINQVLNIKRQSTFIRHYKVQEVVIVAFITAIISYLNSFLRMDSSDLLEQLFQECSATPHSFLCSSGIANGVLLFFALLIACVIRIFLTSISFGLSIPAGIFIPSMVWGALQGRLLGMFVESFYKRHMNSPFFRNICLEGSTCVTPGMYAVIGAIGGLAGITRLTVSLTVIAYELTGTLDYIIPCMITVMAAKITGDYITKGGIVDFAIIAKRFPFLDTREEGLVGLVAADIMTGQSQTVALWDGGITYRTLKDLLRKHDFYGYPVVKRPNHQFAPEVPVLQDGHQHELIGYIRRTDLKFVFDRLTLAMETREGDDSSDQVLNADTLIDFVKRSAGPSSASDGGYSPSPTRSESLHPIVVPRNTVSNLNPILTGEVSARLLSPSTPMRKTRSIRINLGDTEGDNNQNDVFPEEAIDSELSAHINRIENFRGSPVVASAIIATTVHSNPISSSPLINVNEPQLERPTAKTRINLGEYLDHMILRVNPSTEIEFVRELFQSLGPHSLLVEQYGSYQGIITKMDLLDGLRSKTIRAHAPSRMSISNSLDLTDPESRTDLAVYDFNQDPLNISWYEPLGNAYVFVAACICQFFFINILQQSGSGRPGDTEEYLQYVPIIDFRRLIRRMPGIIGRFIIELPHRTRTLYLYAKGFIRNPRQGLAEIRQAFTNRMSRSYEQEDFDHQFVPLGGVFSDGGNAQSMELSSSPPFNMEDELQPNDEFGYPTTTIEMRQQSQLGGDTGNGVSSTLFSLNDDDVVDDIPSIINTRDKFFNLDD